MSLRQRNGHEALAMKMVVVAAEMYRSGGVTLNGVYVYRDELLE